MWQRMIHEVVVARPVAVVDASSHTHRTGIRGVVQRPSGQACTEWRGTEEGGSGYECAAVDDALLGADVSGGVDALGGKIGRAHV